MPDRILIIEDDPARIQAEQRFRSLIENSTDVVAILEGDGTIRYISRSVVRHFGLSPESLVGHTLFDIIHPDDAEKARAAIRLIVKARGSTALEQLRVRHADGTWRVLESLCKNLLDDPAIRGIVMNARDITERQALQQQLWQAQKMEAVGRLAGGVAHDFNNLLTAITGHAQLILAQMSVSDPSRVDLEEIHTAAQRAAGLTRQLLAFSRRQVLQPKVFDLNSIVRDIDNMLRRLIGEDITLIVKPAARRSTVLADPGQLQQVLLNLAVNARDAMPNGGTLAISTWDVSVAGGQSTDLKKGDYVLLEVADTGSGIDDIVLPHIFEPFFTTKELGRGTGLGLSTVHGIISQSGGSVKVDTAPNRGTTFRVYLPLVDRPVDVAPRPMVMDDSPVQVKTILVVEDEAAVRSLARKVLERNGYRVFSASDGVEALQLARDLREPIDLLVTDVVMPRLNGRELVNQLLPERPGIKILYMSGYSEDAIAQHGVLGPGTAFLEKPFTPDGLARKVRDVIAAALA